MQIFITSMKYFLNETKTHLPRLTQLKVDYKQLEFVTEKFTRDATQCNCAEVKELIIKNSIEFSKDIDHYFPSLSV